MFFRTKIKGRIFCIPKTDFGYTEPTDHYQQSIWKVYYFLFIPIWFKTLLIEDVPSWAIFQNNLFGSTDWKSSNPDLIDKIDK